MVSLVACNSTGEGTASTASPSAKAASGAPGPTAQGAKMPELVEMKNDKRHFSFKVPTGTKADASGESYISATRIRGAMCHWPSVMIALLPSENPIAGSSTSRVVLLT
jgi:hypothetical protein